MMRINEQPDSSAFAAHELVAGLQRTGVEFLDDAATRAMYSTDASLYRIPPLVVVRPRSTEDVEAVLELSRREQVPITARGGQARRSQGTPSGVASCSTSAVT